MERSIPGPGSRSGRELDPVGPKEPGLAIDPPGPGRTGLRFHEGPENVIHLKGSRTLLFLTVAFACAQDLLFLFSIIAVSHPDLVTRAGESLLEADASRYQAIAEHPGTPYRDFQVEYPPITLVGIELLDGGTSADTLKEVGVFCLILSFGV